MRQVDWDLEEGLRLKESGMRQAAENRPTLLDYARSLAKQIARNRADRCCTADDVGRIMQGQGYDLGPAAGSLFRDGAWVWTGEFVPSKRQSNHARLLRVWRLKE